MGHAPDISDLSGDLASFRPTFVLAVPRVFEKVYNSAEAKAAAGGRARARLFAAAAATADDSYLARHAQFLGRFSDSVASWRR